MARQLFHYLTLAGVIALGAMLRFWHLDLKPLWLDEVITALFSLGRSYNDVPLEQVFPLELVEQIFTLKPAAACAEISHTIATQSTHPPLFFCLMHRWVAVTLVGAITHGLAWMRSLPALFGVGAITAVYLLNARAFSPAAGLMGAAVMAVSPYAVYLSQEARHYTLPLLLITLALLGLIQIQQDLFQQRLRLGVWLGWAIVNSIGFYTHYFFILAFIAEVVTLVGLVYWRGVGILPAKLIRNSSLAIGLTVIGVVASFIPWLPVMFGHFSRSETSWVPQPHNIAPLYQTLGGWVLTVIALPVENQPLWLALPAGFFMFLFGIWVGWHVFKGMRQLWHSPLTSISQPLRSSSNWTVTKSQLSLFTLLSFTVFVLIEFFVIVYLLGKDLTIVPRYNFVYYPSLCALLSASLSKCQQVEGKIHSFGSTALIVLLVGVISCVFVASDLAFQKPFQPQQVAQNMNQEPFVPLMVVMGYKDYQDVALGLSFALALKKIREESTSEFAFFKPSFEYNWVWEKLSQLPPPTAAKLNLWVVAPGLRRRDYPPQLAISSQATCNLDSKYYYRLGVPYQLYRCKTK